MISNEFVLVVDVLGKRRYLVTEPGRVAERNVLERLRQFLLDLRFVERKADVEVGQDLRATDRFGVIERDVAGRFGIPSPDVVELPVVGDRSASAVVCYWP